MRKLVGLLGIVLVAVVGFVAYLNKDVLLGAGKHAYRQAQGYTPAKTPQEAVDRFRAAIQKYDYENASLYLGGDYGEQMRRGGEAAGKLGAEIDSLLHQMKTREKTSEQCEYTLRMFAPFPTEFEITDIKNQGDDKATGIITDKSAGGFKNINPTQLPKIDPYLSHTFFRYPVTAVKIEFKLEGSGNEKSWKMHFPMNEEIRKSVERLNVKSADCVQTLKKVRHEVEHQPMTGKDLEGLLKAQMEKMESK
jgi:hypothetical protein